MLRFLTQALRLASVAAWLCACAADSTTLLETPAPGAGTPVTATEIETQLGRNAAIPPVNPASAPLLQWRPATRELHWRYANSGDYNQDGVVDLSDLTVIAEQFYAAGPFDETGPAHAADGDGNGEVNAADIAVIARYFQIDVESYRIYAAMLPGAAELPGPDAVVLAEVLFSSGEALDGGALQFAFVLDEQAQHAYYWVVPVSEDVEGIPSNRVTIGQPPAARLELDPPSGMVPFSTRLDATLSTPGDGSITDYSWDLDGDGEFEISTGSLPVMHHTFSAAGDYPVAVKVTGSNGLAAVAQAQAGVQELALAFHPWRETLEYNGFHDELDVVYWESGNRGFVEIRAENARGMEGLYGELSYDDSSLRYLDHVVLPGGGPPWDWTSLVVHGSEQRLHLGLALLNPQGLPGLYGDVALVRLRFDLLEENAALVERRPPQSPAAGINSLGLDTLSSRLFWRYWSNGDFNQDGEVNAADLKTYALYHGAEVPLDPFSLANLIDTTNNGLVSLDDALSVNSEYGTGLAGFNVYTSLSAGDYPPERTGNNGSGAELLGHVAMHQALNTGSSERLLFGLDVPAALADSYFWLRPVLDGEEGIASNLVEPGSGLFISPDYSDPDWDEVSGQGTEIHLPYFLGGPEPDRDFHLLVSSLPDGEGALLPAENYSWTVAPASSASIPAPGVFIPNGPIGMGYIQAEDAAGNLSNRLYFFAAAAPGT